MSKSDSTGSAVYRYDAPMAMEDLETVTTTNYALGARGADAVSKTDSNGTSVGYPIYDGHGNRAATLTKSGASFSMTDVRTCDAWGNVRVAAQTGRPRARYCANLGHVQDDESSLVYMRARYYEPTSGRSVSEDPSRSGQNWFVYVSCSPTSKIDASGRFGYIDVLAGAIIQWAEQLEDGVAFAAKKWAENKCEVIASKWAGEIAGWILALEVEEFDIASFTSDGLLIERLNDMSPTGRRVIMDLENGEIKFMQGSETMGMAFFEGFLEGFANGLGIP